MLRFLMRPRTISAMTHSTAGTWTIWSMVASAILTTSGLLSCSCQNVELHSQAEQGDGGPGVPTPQINEEDGPWHGGGSTEGRAVLLVLATVLL